MKKRYMKGTEIIENGIFSAQELGELCDRGEITAWMEPGTHHYSTGEQWEEMKCGCHSRTVIPFPFNFEIYAEDNNGHIADPVTASNYAEDIGKMWFSIEDIRKAGGEDINTIVRDGEYGTDDDTIIPSSLWTLQNLQDVVNGMRAAEFPDDAIAYALHCGRRITRTGDIGKLIFGNQYSKVTNARKAKNLLQNQQKRWKLG